MAKSNVLDFLYTPTSSPLEFNFDTLTAPPLLSLLTQEDIFNLNSIARSVKLSGKIKEKYNLIDKIMTSRGFVKLHAGTNRVVYRYSEDQRFVLKIAIDRVGLNDNPAEFQNQFLLKPFVTKIFEVSPCGTVAVVERVDAIMSREEFMSVADDVFNLITKFFVGKYILEDFGSHYFMNWGIRKNGFGLVLLDFPYVFELDGNKLYCNNHPPGRPNIICGGQLDYDDGFNNLICTKCGKHYHARDLSKKGSEELIIVGGKKTMKLKVRVGKEVILDRSKDSMSKVIEPPKTVKKKNKGSELKVKVRIPDDAIFNKKDKYETVVDELSSKVTTTEDQVVNVESENIEMVHAEEVEQITLFEETTEAKSYPDYENKSEDENVSEDENESENENVSEDENESEDEYYDDSDAVEYDKYKSNRDRVREKKNKQKHRHHQNFDNF